MKAAVIHSYSEPPRYGDFDDPVPREGEELVEVTAAALTSLTRTRAAGRHYSGRGPLPAVAGVDGVGRLADGRRVYFNALREPFGSMAQRSLISKGFALPAPDDLDDVTVAALMNPGVPAWLALADRAALQPGERVLILGATGVAGRLAVQCARLQGAKTVIAAGRDERSLRRVAELGADETIALDGDLTAKLAEAADRVGFDVIIDYLWGQPVEALITALTQPGRQAERPHTRLVHVGQAAGPDITLPGEALRATDLVILGYGMGSLRLDRMLAAAERVLHGAAAGELAIETAAVPLADVESVWDVSGHGVRTVLIP
jgi:NADPH:quinone reductase-like Zn-dependent oxidoreductase